MIKLTAVLIGVTVLSGCAGSYLGTMNNEFTRSEKVYVKAFEKRVSPPTWSEFVGVLPPPSIKAVERADRNLNAARSQFTDEEIHRIDHRNAAFNQMWCDAPYAYVRGSVIGGNQYTGYYVTEYTPAYLQHLRFNKKVCTIAESAVILIKQDHANGIHIGAKR